MTTMKPIGLAGTMALAGFALARTLRPARDVTTRRAGTSRTVTVRETREVAYELFRSAYEQFYRGAIDTFTDEEPPVRLAFRHRRMLRRPVIGMVSFLDIGERGTEVRLAIAFEGRTAKLEAAFARMHGKSPAQIASESLRAYKALVEAGEIPVAVRA